MPLHSINPLEDHRWVEFLESNPQSSIFHTRGWLEALRRTYGYEPVVLTTSPPGCPLINGIVFCRIKSWLTGSRLVSLAFSDHCQPLANTPDDLRALIGLLPASVAHHNYRYIELRPLTSNTGDLESNDSFTKSAAFCSHTLDLRPDLDTLFRGFHKSCVQRKIHRAHTEQLIYQDGRSDRLLRQFYFLLALTRRRHKIVPQPLLWFRNLVDCLRDALTIRVVSKDARPVASIMTLYHKNRIVYKYGCSDAQFHMLGGMPLLFWSTIQEGKRLHAEELDLGRSDYDNSGLIQFKNRLGAVPGELNYYRYPACTAIAQYRKTSFMLTLGARAPTVLRRAAGRMLYRHIG